MTFRDSVPLGRTGLRVGRLGLGSSYGLSERGARLAFEHGCNYFFWGSVRTAGMGRAARALARTDRDRLVISIESYARWAAPLRWSVERALRALGVDRVDVLVLGWHDTAPTPAVREAALALREAGKVRHLGVSSHRRPAFRDYLADGVFDVFHLRFSAAHPGARADVFPHLPGEGRPGLVAFTATRWGELLDPRLMPAGEPPLRSPDCYRFALSDPHVDVVLCGPRTDAELEEGLTALDLGPLSAEERARVERIGDHVHGLRTWRSRMMV